MNDNLDIELVQEKNQIIRRIRAIEAIIQSIQEENK